MLFSRLLTTAIRSPTIRNIGVLKTRSFSTTNVRPSAAWSYRDHSPPDKKIEFLAEAFGAFMWWWIFWHCMTDYEHIIGHWEYPDIDGWTDAELGVPPDDADDPE